MLYLQYEVHENVLFLLNDAIIIFRIGDING
jgi:hypothetical protein